MNKFIKILFLLFISCIIKTGVSFSEETKIKIGLLAPLSGENALLGDQIIKSIRMALNDINDNKIEIYPKDTQSDPNITLRSAVELEQMGINLVIGPIFHKNLIYLKEVESITFLSLTASKPSVGSSSNNILGLLMSDLAVPTDLLSPPDKLKQ